MNRRSFLSMLGLAAAGVSTAPLVKKSYFFFGGLWRPQSEYGFIYFPGKVNRLAVYDGRQYAFTENQIFEIVENKLINPKFYNVLITDTGISRGESCSVLNG